jgi:hypothetical protein
MSDITAAAAATPPAADPATTPQTAAGTDQGAAAVTDSGTAVTAAANPALAATVVDLAAPDANAEPDPPSERELAHAALKARLHGIRTQALSGKRQNDLNQVADAVAGLAQVLIDEMG